MTRATHTRTSRKQVQELCDLFNFRFVRHQMLGDRKDYWYLYTIVDENGNYIAEMTSLRDAYYKAAAKAREIVGMKD